MREGKRKGRKKSREEFVRRVRNQRGRTTSQQLLPVFPLTFPAVSVLVGCKGRCVCMGCVGVLDSTPLVSSQVIKISLPFRGIPGKLIV